MIPKKFLFISLLISLTLSVAAQQPTRDDLQKQQQQLLKELVDLNNSLKDIKKNKKAALSAYTVIKNKIRTREALIYNINREIRQLDDQIYYSEVEINHLKKELDTLKDNYAKSIVFAFKNRGSYQYLNFLFSADNFNDAVKRITYLKSYRGYREKEAENILKTQFLLQEKIDEFNSSKKQRSTVLQNQQMQLKVLEEDKKEKDENVKQLKEQEQEIASLIKKKEKERINLNRAIEVAIRRAREEAEKQARLARQKALEDEKRRREKAEKEAKENIARNNKPDAPVTAPTNKPSADVNKPLVSTTSERPYSDLEGTAKGLEQSINFEKNRGNLPWPISGKAVITGRFGKERYGDTKLFIQNDGLILSTDVGTAVKSVADGVVTSVFEIGEAYAVVVQHGKYFTIYNKLSSTSVSIGQSVVAGTLLGRVAANFDGVGEFEFRVTNERNVHLNPEGWLKRAR